MMKKHKGLGIALSILGCWAFCLIFALNKGSLSPLFLIPCILGMTFLYTGLFITAHDAMHGLVSPHARINNAVGTLVLLLYAGFSFQSLRKAHRLHHRYPGTKKDPDWHAAHKDDAFWPWFFHFFLHYFKPIQCLTVPLAVTLIQWYFDLNPFRVALFWVLPSILSSLQLFYFGTYLPHRGSYFLDHHRAHTTNHPSWRTFLECYHFGIHHEHHLYPNLAWWELPTHRHRFLEDKGRSI